MAGHGRFRRQVFRSGPGSLTVNGGTVSVDHPWSARECTDIVGEPDLPHPLEIFRDEYTRVGTITTVDPSAFAQLKDYPFENQGIFPGHNIDPLLPSDTAVITETMAKTNPSRPEVSIPQFIAELRDIPGMLHLKGRKTIEGIPRSSAIEYNFGWSPLIQDLLKMADFTSHVDKRLKELKGLHSNKGLSRGFTSFSTTVKNREPDTTFNSAWSHGLGGHIAYEGTVKKWGSVHWIPEVPFEGTDGDLARQARLLVHGWDISPGAIASTLWELIPWSWFADYFGNVGDYLASQRNGANAIASMGCVMEHHRTVATQVLYPHAPHFVATAGSHLLDQKYRVLVTAGLSATVPFLSIGQLVTMSSLAQSLSRG